MLDYLTRSSIKNKQFKFSQGFTIVELLIVVVVIGILASITVVAYNGIALKAQNTTRISAISQLVKVFEIAKMQTSLSAIRDSLQYDTWYRGCLGKGYPDVDGDGLGDCAIYNGVAFASETEAFNAILNTTATIPTMSSYGTVAATSGDTYYGPYLSSMWIDGKQYFSLEYFLKGEGQSCRLSPLIYYTPANDTTLTPPNNFDFTSSGDGITVCKLVVSEEIDP